MANFSRNSKKQTAIRTDEQQHFSVNEQPPADMSTIELLEQMRQVNEAVKANKLSTILGEQIYDLCKVLMRFGRGKQLEEKHKADLNNFFASIRQAACRENGELGLPCRLKVLELVELRVMGWRPNLSFAQYYSKKEKELQRSSNSGEVLKLQSGNVKNELSLAEIQHLMPCKSAPAVAASSNSPSSSPAPFSPFAQPPPPPNAMPTASSGLLNSMDIPMPLPPPALHPPPTAPGFFFIPSRGGGTFIPVDFPPPPHFPSPCGPLFPHLPPPQLIPSPSRLFPINQMPPNVQQQKSLSNLLGESSEPAAKGKSAAAAAAQQFREEITIRNSDSGKVMGVKGRRVALIEELSQTVISFQKVDPKCKDRQLTVIADSQAAVECAKRLIGQTIERNVSPERPAGEVESSADHLVQDAEKSQSNGPKTIGLTGSSFHVGKESDGSLKIVAQDPAFLAAAQDALSDYLARIAAVVANQKKTIGIGRQEAGPEEEGKVDSAGSPAGKSKGRAYERAELLAIRRSVEANQKLVEEAKRRLHGLDILLDSGTTELTK